MENLISGLKSTQLLKFIKNNFYKHSLGGMNLLGSSTPGVKSKYCVCVFRLSATLK